MEITAFNHPEFGGVRTVEQDGKPWFVGKDIAVALGYSNARDALSNHVDADDKGVAKCDTLGGAQNLSIVNESGLYSLILSSKLPKAKEFKRWVTSEVLPSIRKHGAYMTPATIIECLKRPEGMAVLLGELQAEQQKSAKLEQEITTNAPKVLFADAVSASHTTILVGDLAKLLKQNGVDIGANRLFSWLRNNGYLVRRAGTDYNTPTQRSMELGLFRVKETAVSHSDGHVTTSKTTKVTGKGQAYFVQKFLGGAGLEN